MLIVVVLQQQPCFGRCLLCCLPLASVSSALHLLHFYVVTATQQQSSHRVKLHSIAAGIGAGFQVETNEYIAAELRSVQGESVTRDRNFDAPGEQYADNTEDEQEMENDPNANAAPSSGESDEVSLFVCVADGFHDVSQVWLLTCLCMCLVDCCNVFSHQLP